MVVRTEGRGVCERNYVRGLIRTWSQVKIVEKMKKSKIVIKVLILKKTIVSFLDKGDSVQI